MNAFKNVDDVLDFAIAGEEEAAKFYYHLGDVVEKPWMKELFLSFAKEEEKHKARLLDVKAGKALIASGQKVMDLKIGDYLVDVEAVPGISFQDALIVAMKKEKKAFKLYTDLAAATDNPTLKETFLALAQEEAKHKLYFEVQYDDIVLTEN